MTTTPSTGAPTSASDTESASTSTSGNTSASTGDSPTGSTSTAGSSGHDSGSESGTGSGSGSSASESGSTTACAELSVTELVNYANGSFQFATHAFGQEEVPDYFFIELRTNDVGTYDLAAEPNTTYPSCQQCLSAEVDHHHVSDGRTTYFQTRGSITVDEGTTDTHLVASLAGVRLERWSGDPVPGIDCIEVIDGAVTGQPIEGWNCGGETYGSFDGCDCGCGLLDPDCQGDMRVEACDYCGLEGSCSADGCPGTIDPVNNAVCSQG